MTGVDWEVRRSAIRAAPRRAAWPTNRVTVVYVDADVLYEPGHGGNVAAQGGHVEGGAAVLRMETLVRTRAPRQRRGHRLLRGLCWWHTLARARAFAPFATNHCSAATWPWAAASRNGVRPSESAMSMLDPAPCRASQVSKCPRKAAWCNGVAPFCPAPAPRVRGKKRPLRTKAHRVWRIGIHAVVQ